MSAEAAAPPTNTARVTSSPGDPWEVFGTFTSQPPPPPPLRPSPMAVEVTTFYDADAPDEDVAVGLRRREDVIGLEVAFANFLWHGPAGFHASQVFALEVWTPVRADPIELKSSNDEVIYTSEGAVEWLVLWVPAVRVLMPTTIHGGPSEIAFTTDGVPRGLGALAPASPAVPDQHRGRPVQYLYTKYQTTEGPPAVGS